MNPIRSLVNDFMDLSYHKRLDIANELGITDEADAEIEDIELFKIYFKRIGEKNLFKELWDKINEISGDPNFDNPFI